MRESPEVPTDTENALSRLSRGPTNRFGTHTLTCPTTNQMAKNRGPNKKARSEYVYATTKGEVNEIEISVSATDVQFITPVQSTYSQVEYEKE